MPTLCHFRHTARPAKHRRVRDWRRASYAVTGDEGSSTKTSSFSYDDETRLIQSVVDSGGVSGITTESFTLDGLANRIAHSQTSGAWTFDANNRLIQRGTGANTTTYQYDAAGNLTQKTDTANGISQITQYRYDTQNRLVQVQDGQARLIARYGYDPQNRRIWKEQYRDRAGTALSQAKRSYYLYADEGLIAEATQDISLGAGDVVTATNANAPTIVTQYGPTPDSEFGTNVLFIKTRNSNGQQSFAYYHRDHLGTPMQATDKAGNIVWSASYNVFGQASVTTPAATVNVPTIESNLRLPGQYEDVETGMYYNFNRYYDPVTGRYVTQDPIGLAGGLNRFAYVGASPTFLIDPMGLDSEFMDKVWGGVAWATGGWSPSQGLVDFGAGMGDVVTFGITGAIRKQFDIGSVNMCSASYTAGKVAGVVASIATGFVGGTKAVARASSPNNWSNFSHSLTPASWRRESWWSRTGNRLNGDYIPTTGTRPDLHDLMDGTAAGIGGKFPTWPAWRRFLNRMPYTPGAALYGGASAAANTNTCECDK